MRAAAGWKDYELIDTSGGERLERWGDILLIRPDPQVLWDTPKKKPPLAAGARPVPPFLHRRREVGAV